MKRVFTIILLVLFVLSASFANGTKESSDQKVIRVCQFKVEIADDLLKLAEEYEELTGVKVEVESMSSTNYQTALRSKQAAGELPDIFDHMGTDIFLLLTACLLKQRIQYMPGNTLPGQFHTDLPVALPSFFVIQVFLCIILIVHIALFLYKIAYKLVDANASVGNSGQ